MIEARLPPEQGALVVQALRAADAALRERSTTVPCAAAPEPVATPDARIAGATPPSSGASDAARNATCNDERRQAIEMRARLGSAPDRFAHIDEEQQEALERLEVEAAQQRSSATVSVEDGEPGQWCASARTSVRASVAEPQSAAAAVDDGEPDQRRASDQASVRTSVAEPQSAAIALEDGGERRQHAGSDRTSIRSSVTAVTSLAQQDGWGQRQADAFCLMAESMLASGPVALAAGDRHLVHVRVDLQALCDHDGEGVSAIDDGPSIPPETVRRLCCDGGLVTWLNDREGNTLDVGRKTRVVPSALRRLIQRRDGGCRFPGCEQRRFVDAHHIVHWADGGRTDADNVVLLCRRHHRMLHEGGIRVIGNAQQLTFSDRQGRVLSNAPSLPIVATGHALCEQHTALGLALDDRTAIPGWRGERADYTWLLTILHQRDGLTHGEVAL